MSIRTSQVESAAWRRHTTGVPEFVVVQARHGSNPACVDCRAVPVAGGLRCLGCFLKVSVPRRPGVSGECGTAGGYRRHRKRGEPACDRCRGAWAEREREAAARRRAAA